jgi:hypothetical protein
MDGGGKRKRNRVQRSLGAETMWLAKATGKKRVKKVVKPKKAAKKEVSE